MLTLKIADFLESLRKTGRVLIIDGSPKFVHQIANSMVSAEFSDEVLLDFIIMGCIKILFTENAQEVGKRIFSNETSNARFEAFLNEAKERNGYTADYGREMIRGVFNRLKISLKADELSFNKLKNSSLTFIKPSELSLLDIEDDYGLSAFVESEIKIKVIDGDHASILDNKELSEFIASNI